MTYQDIRKLSWNIAVLGILTVCLFAALSTYGAQDPKGDIRHQHREARYNNNADYQFWKNFFRERNGQWSKRQNGSHNESFYHFVEDKDLNNPAQVASLRNEMAVERMHAVCMSDLIVKGEVIKMQGIITDDDLFIYTVYTFLVTDLLHVRAGIPIQSGDMIEFTMPGGQVNIEGRTITFNYPGFKQLSINDQYIIQLARDAEADDYFISSNNDVYFLDEKNKITRMDAQVWPFYAARARATQSPSDFDTLKAEIQAANCQ